MTEGGIYSDRGEFIKRGNCDQNDLKYYKTTAKSFSQGNKVKPFEKRKALKINVVYL